MTQTSLSSFADPNRHLTISDILRRRSTNRVDVREALLRGLDLSAARSILDLGCGFGFMTEVVARQVALDARIVGIDACPANREPFLERLAATGRSGAFVHQRIGKALDWPDGSFDLVLAGYALYFFPEVVPEVARILSPDGLFVAVTHTESSCRDLLRAAGLPVADAALLGNIGNFSAESGSQVLRPWFAEIERVDYANTLVFEPDQYDEFLVYLSFKLRLLLPDCELSDQLPQPLAPAIRAALSRAPHLVIEKNDAAFRCRCPRCR
jgi:SAM-dependent methyltransferase